MSEEIIQRKRGGAHTYKVYVYDPLRGDYRFLKVVEETEIKDPLRSLLEENGAVIIES